LPYLGGASSGTIVAEGLTNPQIDPGTPWRLTGGSAQVTFANAGDVTYRPGSLEVNSNGGLLFGCVPQAGAPVAAITHVQ